MERIMTDNWIDVLLQVPLAGVVVFLTIRFLAHLEKTNKETLEFIAKQEDVNREFLRTQREQMNNAIMKLAEEIKQNKYDSLKEVSALTANIDRLIEKLIERFEKIIAKMYSRTAFIQEEKME
jgi:L-lactate utilization protein LutC